MNPNKFYDLNKGEINWIPFDIETTGFKSADDDFVTTFILFNDGMYHIWINVDGDTDADASEIESNVREMSGFDNFVVHVCKHETELLQNVEKYLDDANSRNTILTAFNGETFRGTSSFDIPFLRTRCFRQGVEWIFGGLSYTDMYDVISKSNRFDTNIQGEPSLKGMKRSDLVEFANNVGIDINSDSMNKTEIVANLENSDEVTFDGLIKWLNNNNKVSDNKSVTSWSDTTSKNLKQFIDEKSVPISYDRLDKNSVVRKIREDPKYMEQVLVEWHERKGPDIGKTEVKDLDGVHKALFEDRIERTEWHSSLPFDVEVFTPFDPFESSREAVTQYIEGEYGEVIAHCLADVARTVNLTRMVEEYAPKKDYQPKQL